MKSMIVKRIKLWVIGVRMRSNLKQTSEDPHYVEAKLSCIEFQEAKKLLFQVELQIIEFKLQHQAMPIMTFSLSNFRHLRKLNWECGWRSRWSRTNLKSTRKTNLGDDLIICCISY